jgi:hypothetical protein
MTTAQIERLQDHLDRAHRELEELDRNIPLAIADDEDDETVDGMRLRRRELIDDCDDVSQAIEALKARLDSPAAKAEAARRIVKRAAAGKQAEEFLSAADAVDEALAALGRAHSALEKKQRDLHVSLFDAGLSDGGRIGRMMLPALRWATWRAAPNFAKGAAVPRAQQNRRTTMRDALKTLIPNIPA